MLFFDDGKIWQKTNNLFVYFRGKNTKINAGNIKKTLSKADHYTLFLLTLKSKLRQKISMMLQSLSVMDPKNRKKQLFLRSTSLKLYLISFNWINLFEKFFHSDDVLRSKNHSSENESCSTFLQDLHFLLLHFHLH